MTPRSSRPRCTMAFSVYPELYSIFMPDRSRFKGQQRQEHNAAMNFVRNLKICRSGRHLYCRDQPRARLERSPGVATMPTATMRIIVRFGRWRRTSPRSPGAFLDARWAEYKALVSTLCRGNYRRDVAHFPLAFAVLALIRMWPPSVFSTSKAPVLRTRSLSLLNP
jgi:hypothetical protein